MNEQELGDELGRQLAGRVDGDITRPGAATIRARASKITQRRRIAVGAVALAFLLGFGSVAAATLGDRDSSRVIADQPDVTTTTAPPPITTDPTTSTPSSTSSTTSSQPPTTDPTGSQLSGFAVLVAADGQVLRWDGQTTETLATRDDEVVSAALGDDGSLIVGELIGPADDQKQRITKIAPDGTETELIDSGSIVETGVIDGRPVVWIEQSPVPDTSLNIEEWTGDLFLYYLDTGERILWKQDTSGWEQGYGDLEWFGERGFNHWSYAGDFWRLDWIDATNTKVDGPIPPWASDDTYDPKGFDVHSLAAAEDGSYIYWIETPRFESTLERALVGMDANTGEQAFYLELSADEIAPQESTWLVGTDQAGRVMIRIFSGDGSGSERTLLIDPSTAIFTPLDPPGRLISDPLSE